LWTYLSTGTRLKRCQQRNIEIRGLRSSITVGSSAVYLHIIMGGRADYGTAVPGRDIGFSFRRQIRVLSPTWPGRGEGVEGPDVAGFTALSACTLALLKET
jgi:hypothetical protein